MDWMYRNICLAEDDGTGAGPAEPAQDTPQEQAPAYFSQFRKENRERFQGLSKYRSLDELADAALKADQVKEPDYTGWLRIPTAESSKEDIKDFLGKLGVPEGPDKYSLPEETEESMKEISGLMRTAAFRAGLTDSQAKAMYGVLHSVTETAVQRYQAQMKDRVDNFDSRYEGLFSDITDKASRDKAVKESLGYFRTFLSDTGLGKVLKDTGVIYDERIVKALADYQKRNRGSFSSGSQGTQKAQTTKLAYNDEFTKAYGGR